MIRSILISIALITLLLCLILGAVFGLSWWDNKPRIEGPDPATFQPVDPQTLQGVSAGKTNSRNGNMQTDPNNTGVNDTAKTSKNPESSELINNKKSAESKDISRKSDKQNDE